MLAAAVADSLVGQHALEGLFRLQEDLLAVGDEQHTGRAHLPGVEGRKESLAQAGGHDDQPATIAFLSGVPQSD